MGNGVGYLIETFARRDLRGNAGNRIAGRLAGERRAATDTWVHLDDVIRTVLPAATGQGSPDDIPRFQRELNVAPTLDTKRPDDLQPCRPEHLILLVGERLAGRDDDAVSRVHAHRVDVLHVAHGDAVVGRVPHHLVLDLLPSYEGLFQEHLVDGTRCQP